MRTKKTVRKPVTKSIIKHLSLKELMRKTNGNKSDPRIKKILRNPIKSMPGRVSRPLVSMPYFIPNKVSVSVDYSVRFCSSRTTIKSAKTVDMAFNLFKDAWNNYTRVCSCAAQNFISPTKNGMTLLEAGNSIRDIQEAYDGARKAAVNLFVKISKLPPKKQLEWVRKSLGLEMIQTLKLTSEKVVMQTYLSCKDLLHFKS
jgi:hypothetical protein